MGVNQVWLAGECRGVVSNGFTTEGVPALSFVIRTARSSAENPDRTIETNTKVNLYGGALLRKFQASPRDGHYVSVVGELMSRKVGDKLVTEVRAVEINFPEG